MKAYYAHSIFKYNTDVEKYEISLIPYSVVNPNGCVNQTLSEAEIMHECFNLIDECDVLVFSSLDGVIGKGVADEIKHALINGKQVFYIFNNMLNKINEINIHPIQSSSSRRIYATFEWNKEKGGADKDR